MKVITSQQFEGLLDAILNEKKRSNELVHNSFTGITHEDLMREVSAKIGDDKWAVKKGQALKLRMDDIDAVAGNRYYKRVGQMVLLVVLASILLLSNLSAYGFIPTQLFHLTAIGIAIGGISLYGYGRRKERQILHEAIKTGEGLDQGSEG